MPIDYSRYPKDWKERVKRILTRANNCCEFCGLPNKAESYSIKLPVRVNGRYSDRSIWFRDFQDASRTARIFGTDLSRIVVVLTVAHLDHDEENHDVADERLSALCQICHLNYDAKEKFRRAISGERTGLKK